MRSREADGVLMRGPKADGRMAPGHRGRTAPSRDPHTYTSLNSPQFHNQATPIHTTEQPSTTQRTPQRRQAALLHCGRHTRRCSLPWPRLAVLVMVLSNASSSAPASPPAHPLPSPPPPPSLPPTSPINEAALLFAIVVPILILCCAVDFCCRRKRGISVCQALAMWPGRTWGEAAGLATLDGNPVPVSRSYDFPKWRIWRLDHHDRAWAT